jgi:hypothetical protein
MALQMGFWDGEGQIASHRAPWIDAGIGPYLKLCLATPVSAPTHRGRSKGADMRAT